VRLSHGLTLWMEIQIDGEDLRKNMKSQMVLRYHSDSSQILETIVGAEKVETLIKLNKAIHLSSSNKLKVFRVKWKYVWICRSYISYQT